uniref:hypothetical protein n=1 Tax=Parasutterella sp. TaxID=2049037 RepID=UPI003AB66700
FSSKFQDSKILIRLVLDLFATYGVLYLIRLTSLQKNNRTSKSTSEQQGLVCISLKWEIEFNL